MMRKFESPSTMAIIGEDNIVYVYFKSGENVQLEHARAQHEWVMEQFEGRPHYALHEPEFGSTVDPEVREWARSEERTSGVAADAFVVSTLAHKLLANFYLRYNRPTHPTRVFSNKDKAIVWIKQQMQKDE